MEKSFKKKFEKKKKKRTRSFLPILPGLALHLVLTRHRTPKPPVARSASATNCSLSHEKRRILGEVSVAMPVRGGRRDLSARRLER